MTVPADKAQAIYANWQNPPGDLTEEQYDMLKCIEHVYFNQGSRKNYNEPKPSHLTNQGVQQGMYEALPRGDR